MTFEHVLDVFREYLENDDVYEIVTTRYGYVILDWDRRRLDYNGAHLCGTPEILMEELIGAFKNYFEYITTNGERDMTPQEQREMEAQVRAYRDRCLNG